MKMVQNIKEHKQTNLQLLIFWENDKVPTKVGVSLSLSQWKVLCSATQNGKVWVIFGFFFCIFSSPHHFT
jgi:hypothetical protein